MFTSFSLRQKIGVAVALVAFLSVWGIVGAVSKLGKVAVVVKVAPSDSRVILDGKTSRAGRLYVKPGKHVFVAKRADFSDDTVSLSVNKTTESIILIPTPASGDAKAWLIQHPAEQAKREALGGERANKSGLAAYNNNPLLAKLPATGAAQGGYYRIDAGIPVNGSSEPAIYITASSPVSRSFALDYIRTLGYNPADMDIVFNNVVTGFSLGGAAHAE